MSEASIGPELVRRHDSSCAHCGLPVPVVEVRAIDPLQFCCSGCRAVHAALHECGLGQFYALRDRESVADASGAEPALVTGRGFEHLDDVRFLGAQTRIDDAGMRRAELRIDGIRCGACIWPELCAALSRCASIARAELHGSPGMSGRLGCPRLRGDLTRSAISCIRWATPMR